MSVEIVFETHALSEDNERGIATGWLPGRLSAQGRANAAEMGRRRRDDDIAAVVTSDLRSGGSWPTAPRMTPPPTTSTATSSPPPKPSTGLENALAGLGFLDETLALDLRKPRTTCTAYGPPPYAPTTSQTPLTMTPTPAGRSTARTARDDSSRAPHGPGALAARRRGTEAALQRVHEALQRLRREKPASPAAAVARRADVSRTFLYDNREARNAVAAAMAQAGPAPHQHALTQCRYGAAIAARQCVVPSVAGRRAMTGDSGGGPWPRIQNHVADSTVDYLVQVGVLNGPLNLHFVVQSPAPEDPLEKAADVLARSVFAQWREEANTWDMADPEPLKVSWTQRWDVADHPEKVGGNHSGPTHEVDTIARAFLAGEQRRLVILGDAGAGKTTLAVLLALELLTRRLHDGERHGVPLVLPLSDWDSERQHFRTWLTQRITADHPGLPTVEGHHPAAQLVSDRRVIPVLDGLDELPPHRQQAALNGLNHALAPGDPVVLTSRNAEYEALASAGNLVNSAAVVEALPVTAEVGVEYLRRATPPAVVHRWEPVFAELQHHPAGPLAEALSTPLMLWLARRTYRHPPADPADLLDARRLPDRSAIEDHLLDNIVPTVFAQAPHAPDRIHAPGQWSPGRAHRWLAFLAGHLTRRQTAELDWWRLHTATLPRVLGLPMLVVLGIALGAMVDALIGWQARTNPRTGDLFLDTLGPSDALLGGIVFGLLVRTGTLYWFGDRLWQPRRRANPFRLGAALRSASRGTSLRRAFGAGAVVVVPSALISLLVLGEGMRDALVLLVFLGYAVPAVLMVVFAAPADTVDAPSPDALLRAEGRSVGLTVGIVAPLIGLGQAAPDWVSEVGHRGWPEVLTGWFGAAAVLALFSPWSRWQLARCTLALAGRLPWSLPEFLRDAHRNGLLQRSGGSYRFRNLRLQQRLAATRGRPPVPRQRTAPSPHDAPAEQPGPTAAPVGQPPGGAVVRSLSTNRNFRVSETPGGYLAQGHSRRFVIAHWRGLPLFIGGWALLITLTGRWADPVAWIPVPGLVSVWILITLVGYLLPGKRMKLWITAEFIESALGRELSAHRWEDVEQIAIRKVFRRGVDSGYYGLHVRLRPGAPPPPPYFAGADGWWLVLPIAVDQAVPPDVAAALARYAGRRWQPPIPPG